mgnify:CR=1 FL=1
MLLLSSMRPLVLKHYVVGNMLLLSKKKMCVCVCVCVYEQQQIPVQQISTDNKDDNENPSSSSIKQNNVTDRNSNVKCSESTDKSKRCNSNFKHTKSNTKPHQVSVLNHTNERYRSFIPNHSNVPIKQQLTLCVFSSSIKVN